MFTIVGEFISVDFKPSFFPYDRDVLEAFFPGRDVVVSKDMSKWYGVTCTMDEWEAFMNFAQYAVRADPDVIKTTETLALIQKFDGEYKVFQSNMILGPVKTPQEWGRLVA